MREKKNIHKFIPVNTYDIPGMETWLADMAEKGLYLNYFSLMFGIFQKGDPKKVRYRLEMAGGDKTMPEYDSRQFYEENGWNFVDTFRKLFYVFIAEDESAQELHTDPVVQSYTLDKLNRQLKPFLIMFVVVIAAMVGLTLFTIIKGDYVNNILLHYSTYNFFSFLFWQLIGIRLVTSSLSIIKLRKRLRSGVPLEHHRKYKRSLIIEIGVYVLYGAMIAALIAGLVHDNKNGWDKYQMLSEADGYIPPVYLADIEQDEGFHYIDGYIQGNDDNNVINYDYRNKIYYENSALVPVQCFVSQYGEITGRIEADGSGVYIPRLNVYYYETAFDFLAEPLFEEMVQIHCRWGNLKPDYVALETGLLDGAIYSQNDGAQQLVAYQGKKVIVLWYNGEEDLTESLDYLEDVLT